MTAAIRAAILCLHFAVLFGCTAPPSANVQPATTSSPATRLPDSLLALMTLEEKIGQLTMAPAEWGQTGPQAKGGGDQPVRDGRIGSFLNFWGAAATRRMQRVAVEGSRLHIPLLFAHDVIHGWRTIFPVSLAEAASFDTVAVQGAARVAAVEASAHRVHWTFAPMVDIARDARWGRVVEGAGEDPFLGSAMAAARVRGFQGDDLASPATIMAPPSISRRTARRRADGTTTWPTFRSVRCGRSTSRRSRPRCAPAPAPSWRPSTRSAARRRTRANGSWKTCCAADGASPGWW